MGISKEAFVEGEVYRCKRTESFRYPSDHIFVIGVHTENDGGVILAIFWVEKDTMNMIEPGEIEIPKNEFDKWEKVELI